MIKITRKQKNVGITGKKVIEDKTVTSIKGGLSDYRKRVASQKDKNKDVTIYVLGKKLVAIYD